MPVPAAPRPIWPTTLDAQVDARALRGVDERREHHDRRAVLIVVQDRLAEARASCSSISKHAGAAMSSSWIAPKEMRCVDDVDDAPGACVDQDRHAGDVRRSRRRSPPCPP